MYLPHVQVPELDQCDYESLRPTKHRQQLPPSPPTSSHSPDKVPRLSHPQNAPLTSQEPLQSPKKRRWEEDNCAPYSDSKKRRIEDWIRSTRSRRENCPPRIELKDPVTEKGQYASAPRDSCPPRLETNDLDAGRGSRPLLEVLQEMSQSQSQSQSQKQSLGAGSVTSGRNARSTTSHLDYRSILRNNCVHIDHTGERIPPELRAFLDSSIIKQQSEPLSPEAIAEAVKAAIEIADSPESNIYDLTGTALLPVKRSDVGRAGNTPWHTDTLPKTDAYDIPLA